jgi:hypothetical protein
MEFLAGGSLNGVLEDDSVALSLQDQIGLMVGIATGLVHLHHEKIVHRVRYLAIHPHIPRVAHPRHMNRISLQETSCYLPLVLPRLPISV